MITAIHKSLAAKREALKNGEQGFTLIELLIVVLIIGVLAAIAIPVYLTTVDTARDNSAKTTAADAKAFVVAKYTESGTLPAADGAGNVTGFQPSADIDLLYVPGAGSSFTICADAGDHVYKTSNSTPVAKDTAVTSC